MIEELLALIEQEIKTQNFGTEPKSLYEPLRYIMALGGKRMRPLLTLLAYSLYQDNAKSVARYATAVEAFHNFTLLHDDIMDNAPLRRGKKTVHEKWNVNTAILSGDVMLVRVYEMFLDLEDQKLRDVLRIFSACAAEVCEGQQRDMEFEKARTITEADYLEMIRQKTAVLLGFSLELGAVLGDAPAADRQALRDFGISIGIGFQLKDDLLDVYADKKKFGKQVGGDILANKKTFLLIKALEKAKGKDKLALRKWLAVTTAPNEKKVKAVTALYDKLGVPALTHQRIQEYFNRGFEMLAHLSSSRKEPLLTFTRNLIERQS